MADATRSLKIVVEEERKGDAYAQAADDLDRYGHSVGEADARTKQWAEDQKRLEVEVSKSKDRIKELHQEVARTGDTSLFGDIRKEESRIKGFESTLKALAPEAEKAAVNFGAEFAKGFEDVPFQGVLIGGLVGAAVLASPGIAAAISAAVTGVVGVGGIAGGIFAASKDPGVRSAAAKFGQDISKEFFGSGDPFIAPIKESLGILERGFEGMHLEKTFQLAAPFVTEFAHGIAGLAEDFMPGFNRALIDGAPAISLLAAELPRVGESLGDFLDKMASSKGTMQGVDSIFNLVVNTIDATGTVLGWLGDKYDWFNHKTIGFGHFMEQVSHFAQMPTMEGFWRQFADGSQELVDAGTQVAAIHFKNPADEIKYLGSVTGDAADETKRFADAIRALEDETRKALGQVSSLADADLAVSQTMLDLNKNLVEGKSHWDINTQAGHDNIQMIQHAIETIERRREAAVDAANGDVAAVATANAAFQSQLLKIEKVGAAAGATRTQLDAMAKTYVITVAVESGIAKIGSLISGALSSVLQPLHLGGHRAMGGPVRAGTTYKINENTPNSEYFTAAQDGVITPASQMQASGAGGGRVKVELSIATTGDRLMDAILEALRLRVASEGGLTATFG